MQTILDGKALAAKIKEQAKRRIPMGYIPCLAVILVGDDPASAVYVKNKSKDCQECGISCAEYHFNAEVSQAEVIDLVRRLNNDATVDGILVQLPLPKHIDTNAVLQEISPAKDVDCFHPFNVGKLYTGLSGFKPCTPAGIIALLDEYNIELKGKVVTVVGRSNIVGKPIAAMLTQRDATVFQCHSKTPQEVLRACLGQSDILVSAVGSTEYLKPYTPSPTVLVDVGMNKNAEGKLCGDIPAEWLERDGIAYTPVPGGVGPMTRAMLMQNVVRAAQYRKLSEVAKSAE